MAWATQALHSYRGARRPSRRVLRRHRRHGPTLTGRTKHYGNARGKYRVFNSAGYCFYHSTTGAPVKPEDLFDTNATLPHTPADTFGNGTHYVGVTRDNGIEESDFLRIGPNGEPYLRIEISAGAEVEEPPHSPDHVHLEQLEGGKVKVVGYYFHTGTERAEEWAIYYTTDGSTPNSGPTDDSPDYHPDMTAGGIQVLSQEIDTSAQDHGTTIKVRVQTRRDDGGSNTYSDTSDDDVLTITTDKTGPDAPPAGESWYGRLPEES